ncbi:MAG TPA: glycosyltransferase [Acidimicrobiales bacterium]|nr:glycosyltransferase [Acidimicrobiales bacterium]
MTSYGQVAVVVPTHQRRALALEAVRSVLAQSYADWRCIVVDNGSSDGTAEAIRAIRDERISVIDHAAPLRPGPARNLGLAAAQGAQWVAFLDSDDLWAPDKVELQLAALAALPGTGWSSTGWAHFKDYKVISARQFDPNPVPKTGPQRVEGERIFEKLHDDDEIPIATSSVIVSRELVNKTGDFDADMKFGSDWDYWLRLARESPMAYLDLPMVAFRTWEGQMTLSHPGFSETREEWSRNLAEAERRRLPRHRAIWEQSLAASQLLGGERLQAAKSYTRAAFFGHAPGQLAYALACLAYPAAATKRIEKIARTRSPLEQWRAAVEPWLSSYRADTTT